MTTRRTFLTFLGSLPVGVGGLASWSRAEARLANAGGATRGDLDDGAEAMDEALQMLAPYGASFGGGLSNHGPMTAEALVALGHQDAVIEWVASYRGRLEERPAPRSLIRRADWKDALGDSSRIGDWDEWFSNELAELPWREVVSRWVPRLAPGMAAAGFHSVIRVGHAVCSLEARENDLRRDELARALAYWAAEFLPLPGQYSGTGKLTPSNALKKTEVLPSEQRVSRGLISTQLGDLVGFEPFLEVINLVDPQAGAPNFMSDLLGTFAGTFTNTPSSTFDFLHAVTGAAAVAELLPYVEPEQRDRVRAYAWQVTASIYARYGRSGLSADVETPSDDKESLEQLAKLAVASGDEHTIKLTAACRREWQRNPDPRLLTAAARRVHGR